MRKLLYTLGILILSVSLPVFGQTVRPGAESEPNDRERMMSASDTGRTEKRGDIA